MLGTELPFPKQALVFTCLQHKSFENTVGKKEISLDCSLQGQPFSQTSPGFYVSAVQVFGKNCGEKEKLLLMSNFSFSHSVFHPFRELSAIFIKSEIVVCKVFQFGRLYNL